MRWSRIQRHLFAVLSVVLLGVGMSLMTTGGAGAAATTEGNFTLGVDARLDLGFPSTAPVQNLGVGLQSAAPLSGSVDRAGDIQIQPSGVTLTSNANPIDRVTDSLLQPPLDQVAFVAPHGFSGFIDPSTKSADLFATGATFVFSSLDPNTPFQCSTIPGDFSVHASDYDPSTGNATFLSAATFMIGQIDLSNPSCAALNGLNTPAAPAGDTPAPPPTHGHGAGPATSTPASTSTATSEIASGVASTTDPPIGTAGAVFGSPVSALFVAHAQFAPPVTTPAPPASSPSTPPATHQGSGTGSTPPGTTRALSSTAVAGGSHASAASHTSHRTSSSKHRAATTSSKSKKSKSPSTTAYVWKGGSDSGVASGIDPVGPDAVASPRLPQATASASHQSPTDSRFGIGVIALVVGGTLGGFVLLRSEAKRLLRRRPHAAF